MKLGIYARKLSEKVLLYLPELLLAINKINAQVWFHENIANNNLGKVNVIDQKSIPNDLDFLITIGGDGTFLDALSEIKLSDIPLLGINTGRLGFLADISPNEIAEAIQSIAEKKYKIEHRSILETIIDPAQNIRFPYAINDLTVHKRDTSSMIVVHVYIDDVFLANYWADGLIIATPTGSTAYSMSVGGPIILPSSNNLVITPIASHNLTVRPLVIPGNNKISLKIESRDSKFLLSLDSRSYVIDETIKIQVKNSKKKISLIKLDNHSYYSTLRNKLMWGVDNRN